MIHEHNIPILEYDDTSPEVLSPSLQMEGVKLPEKCLFAFLGSTVDRYAETHGAIIASYFKMISQEIPVYILPKDNICIVSAPLGAPPATLFLDALITRGCRKIIATGSCGILTDLPENVFLIPAKALRDEGTSYQYQPPSRYIVLDEEPIEAIKETFSQSGLSYKTCTTWTTDGIFRETKDMVKYRREEGCEVVEMECSALAACSRKRSAVFGQFLFTADSLSNVHEYNPRDFGKASHEKALLLGIEILRNIN